MDSLFASARLKAGKQKFFLIAGNLLVFYILINEMLFSNVYPESKIQNARHTAAVMAQSGKLDEAEKRLKAILRIAPNNQSLWIDYLVVLSWHDKHKSAIEKLDQVILDQAPDYFFDAMIHSAIELHEYDLAQSLLRKQPTPNHTHGLRLLSALSVSGNADKVQPLKKWLTQNFNHQYSTEKIHSETDISLTLSQNKILMKAEVPGNRLHTSANDHVYSTTQSLPMQGENLSLLGINNDLEHLAKTRRENGDLSQARRLYEKGMSIDPDNEQYEIGLALVLAEQGDFSLSRKILNERINKNSEDVQALHALVYLYQLSNDPLLELDTMAQYLKIYPVEETIETWIHRWVSQKSKIGVVKVSEKINELFKALPTSPALLFNHIALLEQRGMCTEVMAYADRVVAQGMLPIYPIETLMRCARDLKLIEQAKFLAILGQKLYPGYDSFVIFEALIDIDANEPSVALTKLETIENKSKDYYKAKAYAYAVLDKPIDSAAAYYNILSRWPGDSEAFVAYTMHLSNAGGAISALEKAQTRW